MKKIDKNLIIMLAVLLAIICISIYFLTKGENEEIISTEEFYISTNSTTIVEEAKEIIVHIDGEVINKGLVTLKEGSRISDAISAAGGTTPIADVSKINLAYELKDAQKVYIPSIYDLEETIYIQNDAGSNVIVSDNPTSSTLININTASKSELETLPGIGSSTATKIIDYRTKNGNFKKIEDIKNVSGIGEAKFNNIKDNICI